MVYIPFASLLGLQAALEPLVVKQSAPETASLEGINFVDPRPGGGSLLDHDSGGLGEPLNVSAQSSLSTCLGADLRKKIQNIIRLSFRASAIRGSLLTVVLYTLRTRSDCELLIFRLSRIPLIPTRASGKECFGAHLGAPQTANLGDGNGAVNQTIELRNDYGNPDIGACWESLVGGNHLRMWRQNGPNAHTNALFLAYVNVNTMCHIVF